MGIYDKLNAKLNNLSERLYLKRTEIGEKQAIKKKKDYISDVEWSDEQNKAFDGYWLKNYGKAIPKDWHKLYQKECGVFRVDYFPEFLFSTKLEPKLNPKKYCDVFANKALLYSMFNGIEGIRCPKAYVINSFGRFSDGEQNIISAEEAQKAVENAGTVLIKATLDSSGGKSIIVCDFKNGKDTKTGKTVSEIFASYGQNFVVQEKIKPSKELSAIYPDALNTFRIITYIADDHIGCCPVAMRMGVGGMQVDNITSGGLCVGVNKDGTLKKYASNTRYGDEFNKLFERHPDTNTAFAKVTIPQVPDMIEIAKKMHRRTPQVGMISWDLSVGSDDEIILIEANYFDQSAWFPQIINGEPLFGEDTPYMIDLIRNK